jgi:DNA internalization competence protein ComEC/Rec2-like protein
MQVGFFMDAFRKSLLRLDMTQEKFKWLAYPFSLFYAGLTGFSASVIRSLLQKILSQHGFKGLDNFAMTVLLLFIVMPNFFLTAGGVLSCAYAFILTMTSKKGQGIKAVVRESFIISLGILPILSFYFSEFQPWSIVLTFAFSFLFDMVLLPLLSILFCLSMIYPFTQFNFIFEWLESIIRFVYQLSSRPIVFGQPNVWILLALLIALALLYDLRKNFKRLTLLAFLVAPLFLVTKHPIENEITVLAMDQGSSIFLRDMTGKTILIDVGREKESEKKEGWQEKVSSSTVQRNLIPYLKSRGVAKIDQLVLTTGDAKQLGNLLELTKAFEIGEILLPEVILEQKVFVEKLKSSKVKVGAIKKGEDLSIFGSRLEVSHLSGDKSGEVSDSLFLHGKLLNQTFLFANDIKEKELSKQYSNQQVDVVITSQTASKGRSGLEDFNLLNPKLTVLSADQKKNFKDQQQASVLEKEEKTSKVHHTNQQGAIRFKGWTSWQFETVQ